MTNEVLDYILKIVHSCQFVYLSTINLDNYPETRHLMNTMNEKAENLYLHFLTGLYSPKMEQLERNDKAGLYYYNQQTHHAVRLFGRIQVVDNPVERMQYWNDSYKMFGYTGPEDKNWGLIAFIPDGYKYYSGGEIIADKIK
ncbi:MAG: pyridoxamine 5'-phosphate oxidase family protein [Alphaproteobacteria bacterium]|nr:pyridoxamine 5'-phosphate oxidase family protein [Alphaproteobacteria bacterium]